ncbi:MAG: redoxin domain-containing protein [Nitrospirae bacterium]|nr:redoxin domain-containing protein [Nitrospirota bacterium]
MIFLILFTSLFLIFGPSADAFSISQGEAAPEFTLTSFDGKAVSLAEYKGETLVLIYWRTGQDRSLLALKDAYDELKKYEKKGVRVLSVITDTDNKEDAPKLLRDKGIDYPLLIDADRQLYSGYGIKVYPTTFIIDKQGKIAYEIPSHPLTYKNTLDGYIRQLLGEISDTELKDVLSPHKEEKDRSLLEAERLYNLAFQFTQAGLLDQAVDTAARSAAAKPDMVKSHILLGFLHLELKDTDKALASFNKALELDPRSHDAQTGLGGALVLKGDIDKALELLNDAAVSNPYPQMTYYELGKAYEQKGEKDRAIEMYKKAIEKIIKKQVLPSAISRCQ